MSRDKTTPRIRGTTPEIEQAAKDLRRARTPAETILRRALRNKQLGGLRFRFQHPVGPFILDFYCPQHRLVVEVDGAVHDDPDQHIHDEARTEQLAAYGYRVIRFRNREVLDDLSGVLQRILETTRAHGQGEGLRLGVGPETP
jgi:very-short-patch-repair endonuclease